MLSFEIGKQESDFYSERTDRITEPSSTVLIYKLSITVTIIIRLGKLRNKLYRIIVGYSEKVKVYLHKKNYPK